MPKGARDMKFFQAMAALVRSRWWSRQAVGASLRRLGVGAGVGLLLAFLGPTGTFEASLRSRILFWIPLLVVGTFAGELVSRATSRRLGKNENFIARWAVLTAAVAFPMALVSWLLARAVFGGGPGDRFILFVWAAFLVSGGMTALMAAINTPGSETRAVPAAVIKLRERLPVELRDAEIRAAASEDHYLRVYTSAGEAFILLRLGDAISELDGIAGAQVHRSWWVARAAVEGVERQGRGYVLILKGDVRAPVSRANVPHLRAGGWFDNSGTVHAS